MAGVHTGSILDKVDKYNVIECSHCGFKHLDPIPSEDELQEFYNKQYFQTAKPEYLEEDRREIIHRNIFFDQRIDFFSKFAPGTTLLDVGCGDGLFLERAREKGFNVFGIEPSEQASSIGRDSGLEIFHGTLNTFMQNNSRLFDIVHLKNVLEHVDKPIQVLEECASLLNSGGILYVEVPNDYDLFQRLGVWIHNERKSWLCIPDHINYFNFRSAEKLLQKLKFSVLRRDTTFPMYMFLCLGFNFIRYKALGKRLHNLRVKIEMFCFKRGLNTFRRIVYRGLAQLGLGRTVILYAKKH